MVEVENTLKRPVKCSFELHEWVLIPTVSRFSCWRRFLLWLASFLNNMFVDFGRLDAQRVPWASRGKERQL